MDGGIAKQLGAYYTPAPVVAALTKWAVRDPEDRLLDPSCGDGRFIASHPRSFGVDRDGAAIDAAAARAPWATLHLGDFFAWAKDTEERFDCAAGNPPFIRYQSFSGTVRQQALSYCARHGVRFSGLTSSWAPFIVAAATLLKRGGRMAFVVPAEIGHAPYAAPVLVYLAANFAKVQVIAIREKLFPQLSEDCWLLYADGFGGATDHVLLTPVERFSFLEQPPSHGVHVPLVTWRRDWNCRLRPFLMSGEARELYQRAATAPGACRLGDMASVGIGYVSGANDFFHLRPSAAERLGIPSELLRPSVRNGRVLSQERLTEAAVREWYGADAPVLLLRLSRGAPLPDSVRRYLDTEAGQRARTGYKCRNRDPWFVVPDVSVPDFFLSYMSGGRPRLVANDAECVCTNSVHAVRLHDRSDAAALSRLWRNPLVELSCEVEGHPLGGGMLKLEPGEASRLVLSFGTCRTAAERDALQAGLVAMRQWRHCA